VISAGPDADYSVVAEIGTPSLAHRASQADFSPDLLSSCRHRIAFSKVGDLFNVVHKAVEHPLDSDLDPPPYGKPVHSLAGPNVTENRFYDAQPLAVRAPPLRCVNLLFHLIGKAARSFTIKHMNLSRYRRGVAETFKTQWAITTGRLRCLIGNGLVSVCRLEVSVPDV
jgi:hypothetical protein